MSIVLHVFGVSGIAATFTGTKTSLIRSVYFDAPDASKIPMPSQKVRSINTHAVLFVEEHGVAAEVTLLVAPNIAC